MSEGTDSVFKTKKVPEFTYAEFLLWSQKLWQCRPHLMKALSGPGEHLEIIKPSKLL
jgi:hypothetical protein